MHLPERLLQSVTTKNEQQRRTNRLGHDGNRLTSHTEEDTHKPLVNFTHTAESLTTNHVPRQVTKSLLIATVLQHLAF